MREFKQGGVHLVPKDSLIKSTSDKYYFFSVICVVNNKYLLQL